MTSATVVVVSGDAAVRDSLTELLRSAGLSAEPYSSLETWPKAVPPEQRGCLVVDAQVGS